jgi:hypothetical protein
VVIHRRNFSANIRIISKLEVFCILFLNFSLYFCKRNLKLIYCLIKIDLIMSQNSTNQNSTNQNSNSKGSFWSSLFKIILATAITTAAGKATDALNKK